MNSAIVSDWLKKFNAKMHDRSVFLLVDNVSSHVNLDLASLIRPRQTTDDFLRWMLLQIQGNTGIKHIVLLSSITHIIQAWKEVSPTAISYCWVHTDIVSAPRAAFLKQKSEPRRRSIINELGELFQKLALDDPMTAVICINQRRD
jgi:hypothetical protein